MKKITEAYFENKAEQAKIIQAVIGAIPTGVYYHNVIAALADLLSAFTLLNAYDVFTASHKAAQQSEAAEAGSEPPVTE